MKVITCCGNEITVIFTTEVNGSMQFGMCDVHKEDPLFEFFKRRENI